MHKERLLLRGIYLLPDLAQLLLSLPEYHHGIGHFHHCFGLNLLNDRARVSDIHDHRCNLSILYRIAFKYRKLKTYLLRYCQRIVVRYNVKGTTMERKEKDSIIKIITAITFLIMVIVNGLANTLPINGVNTGQISDSYPNLFAPAGLTFAIWGLIYLLLAGYTLYQLGIFRGDTKATRTELLSRIGVLFSISSIANTAWVFAWHYHMVPLSMLLMIVILVCLILINQTMMNQGFSQREYLFIRLPFSVYFGWITVATIANATVLLVSIGWKGFGLAEATWAVIMISAGLIIAVATMLKNRDIAYGLVIVWAYAGILLKHTSSEGFAGQYPAVITTTMVCIFLLLLAEAYILRSARKRKAV